MRTVACRVLVLSLLLAACSSFGTTSSTGSEESASDAAAPHTEEAGRREDGEAPDAATAKVDSGARETFACAAETCTVGLSGCCLHDDTTPTCTPTCSGWFLRCSGKKDCPNGEVCCLEDDHVATCKLSCSKRTLCTALEDCVTGGCNPVACDGVERFSYCSKGSTASVGYNGVTCSFN